MLPYGSDRVRVDGERVHLASRWPKESWNARIERTLTTSEHPGTAVQWEGLCYEVVQVEALPNGGVRYLLEPWLEHHTIRTMSAYDEASETARAAERRARAKRESQRLATNWLALLTGHLPAPVQRHLANELNVAPERLSLVSIVGEFVLGAAVVLRAVKHVFDPAARHVPLGLLMVAALVLLEALTRFTIVFSSGRPAGSVFGFVAYSLYYVIGPRRGKVAPLQIEKGFTVRIGETPEELKLHDALLMCEPLVTLLTPEEQAGVAARLGYDYKRYSMTVAWCIFACALAGVISLLMKLTSSPSLHTLLALLAAGYVAGEQLHRLLILRERPIASILRHLARPFVRKVL